MITAIEAKATANKIRIEKGISDPFQKELSDIYSLIKEASDRGDMNINYVVKSTDPAIVAKFKKNLKDNGYTVQKYKTSNNDRFGVEIDCNYKLLIEWENAHE